MNAAIPAQYFLDAEGDSAYLAVHVTPGEDPARAGVLLCPPFGWDEICAYRPLRVWAEELAAGGIPTARLSYPSTGDSGGRVSDPRRLDAWTAAVDAAVRWLRETGLCEQVTVIGLELGGLVALRAAAAAAPGAGPDAIALWATPARGQRMLRQLKAFSQIEEASFYDELPAPPPLAPGEIEAGGFRLSAETVRDVGGLDASRLSFSTSAPPRALLLGRDGLPVDARLRETLEAAGSEVTVADGPGYADMVSHAQTARPAWPVLDAIAGWLAQTPPPATPESSRPTSPAPGVARTLTITGGSEQPLAIDHGRVQLSGILTRPAGSAQDLGLVMLNAGAIRRIGPNRMWTEAARRWAPRGVATLRLDLESLGESGGPENVYADASALYAPELEAQIRASIDRFAVETGCQRFMVIGMCSGAYWAVQLAVADERVTSAFSVNPRALVWDEGLIPARNFRAFWLRPISIRRIGRALRSERLPVVLKWLARSGQRRLTGWLRRAQATEPTPSTEALLDALRHSGARAYFTFAADEPLLDELARSGELERLAGWDTARVEHIAVRDHLVRAAWAQDRLHALLDAAIEDELQRGHGPDLTGGQAAQSAVSSPL